MLDIHPAHHAATTWRDFFIHIATIVLGLLIAVGLEQTVEHFHHRYQVHQIADALREESLGNRAIIQHDLALIKQLQQDVHANMLEIDRIRLEPSASGYRPAELSSGQFHVPSNSAWLSVRDSALLPLIPKRLANNYWRVDFSQERATYLMATCSELRDRVNSLSQLHASATMLSAPERDALLLAFSQYTQCLTHLDSMLKRFGDQNETAIANETVTVVPTANP